MTERDRDAERRPRTARLRDTLGRPLPRGTTGVARQTERVLRTPAQTLREAQRLLDEGLPFDAHEVLEDAWKAAASADRALWRGLAQLAVGATHAARGNRTGALSLLRRGAALIAPYEPEAPHGLDVAAVLLWVEGVQQLVNERVPVTLPAPSLSPDQQEPEPNP